MAHRNVFSPVSSDGVQVGGRSITRAVIDLDHVRPVRSINHVAKRCYWGPDPAVDVVALVVWLFSAQNHRSEKALELLLLQHYGQHMHK